MGLLAREAIQLTMQAFPKDTCFVVANGYLSREVYGVEDRPGNFYMIGSMGLGASIALGAALARPERRLAVLDGDGNVLMALGALALIGAEAPKNLLHVCFDNGVYASTGNQPSISRKVSLEGIAREAGYRWSAQAAGRAEVEAKLAELVQQEGPAFLRVLIDPEPHPKEFPRVSHTPEEMRQRFSDALAGKA